MRFLLPYYTTVTKVESPFEILKFLGVEGKIVEVLQEEVQKAADEAQPRMTTIMREMINRI